MSGPRRAASYQDVSYEVEAGVGVLTLNRPQRRNALRLQLMADVEAVLEAASRDSELRALVVTGAGGSFSVGAELSEGDSLVVGVHDDAAGHTSSGYREPAGRITERITALHVPVIGAVNGDAIGGGATMLAAMDVRVCAAGTRFGFVFTRRGVTPEGASTWFLPRLVGHGRAADWLLSGRIFDAEEALAAGFVSSVVPAEEVLPAAREYARQFAAATSPAAVARVRRLLADSWRVQSAGQAAINESLTYREIVETADAREGVASFIERREPRFLSTGLDSFDRPHRQGEAGDER